MELTDTVTALMLGIALSACCGFRVFMPLLVTAIAVKLNFIQPSAGFEWIGTYGALTTFAVAALLEITAYYIPVVDNLLDTLATPGAVIAGMVISASVFADFNPLLKWTAAVILGGGTAGIIQTGTGLLRLGSTKLTATAGNPVIATAENVLSVTGSIFSLLLPVLMFFVFAALVIGVGYLLLKRVVKPTQHT